MVVMVEKDCGGGPRMDQNLPLELLVPFSIGESNSIRQRW